MGHLYTKDANDYYYEIMRLSHTLRSPIRSRSITLVLALSCGLHPGTWAQQSEVPCKVPISEWQYKEALEDKLKKEGWDVRRVKTCKGCYKVDGFDAKGTSKTSYFNPKTLEQVGEAPPQP